MPEQHDPIEELSRFGSGFHTGSTGGDMSLSAADVRRRGDQIRRRRNALVAGGAALAVAAIAVPVLALGGGTPKSDGRNTADDPPPTVAADDLLRDNDTVYFPNERSAFETTDTYGGDGQATFHPCQQQKISALGATSSVTRFYDYVVPPEAGDVVEVSGDGLVEMVAQFDDGVAAQAAYDTFTQWVLDCDVIPGADEVNVQPEARPVDVASGEAAIYDLSWGPVSEEIDPYGDSAFINETGIVLQGDRIAVLALTIVGQDYNFLEEDGGTPVNRMLPIAADRMQAGERKPSPAPTEEPSADAAPVLLPDFDLTDGMAENDSGKPVVADPDGEGVGEIDFCGTVVDPGAAAVERLAADSSGPEYAEAREVLVLPSVEEADALAAKITDAARACPSQDFAGTTWRHEVTDREDQPIRTAVITRTYETDGQPQLGTVHWVVSHDGPVVLLAMSSSEGSAEPAALAESTDEVLARLATPFDEVVDSLEP